MPGRYSLVTVAVLVVFSTTVTAPTVVADSPSTPAPDSHESPAFVAVYPNPLADGDVGEFVVVDTARPTNVTISDGEDDVTVALDGGRVALSPEPTATRALTEYRVVALPGIALSNSGERLTLRVDGRVVDTLVYDRAPAGERLVRGDDRDRRRWVPLGFEPRSVTAHGGAQATAFVLPDSPTTSLRTLRAADERILLAGYTFTSERVAGALMNASERGVRVRVLVDDAPVGGMSVREARLLDDLVDAGVEVRVIGGEGARFSYHHAKYAVVDHAALVLTENWKPAGTGGRASRGWGVRVDSPDLTEELAALFAADAAGRDVASWTRFRRGRSFVSPEVATGSYPPRHDAERLHVESIRLLTAPGNAELAVVDELSRAEHRIDVVQVSVERGHPFVDASLDAARRGVRVRILLAGAWYVREENEATAAWLNTIAENEDLPLEARVAEPNGRYEKIHAKGVVVDETVLLGSLNWNRHATEENREVVVALDGDAVSAYYRTVFERDWGGGRTPRGLVGLAAIAVVAGGLLAWRWLRFERIDAGERRT